MVFKPTQSFFFLLFLIIFSISSNYAAAQSTWARTYGGSGYDTASDIQQTSDGGYIVAGTKDVSPTSDLWIIKLGRDGMVEWEKTFGGVAAEGFGKIQQTSDGGFIVAGLTYSFGSGFNDFWVMKLDESGNVEWESAYGGNSFDFLSSIRQTSDGGFIVSGSTFSFGSGGWDAWLLKLNSTGDIQWQNVYGGIEGEGFELAEETPDGGYVAGGVVQLNGSGENDLWLVKVDANGMIQWQKAYSVSGNESLASFDQTFDGGFIVATSSNDVLKLDSSGIIQWQKRYSTSENASTQSILQTSDFGYTLVGGVGQFGNIDIWMLKLDPSGNIQWQKAFAGGSNDFAEGIHSDLDGGYIIAASTESFGAGSFDLWVLKTDAIGNVDSACSLVNPISFTSADGTLLVQDTVLGSVSTTIVPIATNAIVANGSPIAEKQCGNEPPSAQDDFAITSEDVAVIIDALANDTDPDSDPLVVTAFDQGSNGSVTDNGDGTLTYTPNTNFNGTDSFTYVMSDEDVTDAAVVNVTVISGNDPPNAIDDTATTQEDTAVVIDVLSNDTDPDGSPIGVIGVNQGSNGNVDINGDGTVTYTPNVGFNGLDSFNYTISDGQFSDTASVSVTITPVNNCLFCDDFEDGVLDTNWNYDKNISYWSEAGGKLIAITSRGSTATAGPVFSGCTNCSVTTEMQTAGGFGNRVWLIHHFVDKDNLVELLMKEEADRWVMKIRQGRKIIAKGKILRTVDPNVIYRAKIVYDGARYLAFVDSEMVIALDSEAPVTGGTVGFKVKRTTGNFGAIEVYPQ